MTSRIEKPNMEDNELGFDEVFDLEKDQKGSEVADFDKVLSTVLLLVLRQ